MKRGYLTFLFIIGGVAGILLLMPVHGAAEEPFDVRWPSDAAMHAYFLDRFLHSAGNGIERMLSPLIVVTDSMWLTPDATAFKLGTVELIGVAYHPSPVAFVDLRHRSFPRNVETRALTDFERQALDKLRAGRDVVAQPDRQGRTVIGAIRARETCLGCHNREGKRVQAGDVLGALSYRLDVVKLSYVNPTGGN
jgi:hypothetical protein